MRFEITRQGQVNQPQIVKELRAVPASAIVQAMRWLPRFVPGRHYGRALPTSLIVPVTFEEVK